MAKRPVYTMMGQHQQHGYVAERMEAYANGAAAVADRVLSTLEFEPLDEPVRERLVRVVVRSSLIAQGWARADLEDIDELIRISDDLDVGLAIVRDSAAVCSPASSAGVSPHGGEPGVEVPDGGRRR